MKITNYVCVLPSLHLNVTQATFRTRPPAPKQKEQNLVLPQCKSAHIRTQPHAHTYKFSITYRPAKNIINRYVRLIAHLCLQLGLVPVNETSLLGSGRERKEDNLKPSLHHNLSLIHRP